jgi:hypothetical protein
MKIKTLAIITFTALCAHHDAQAMLCISKLRSFAPLYQQAQRSMIIWNIADYEESLRREKERSLTKTIEDKLFADIQARISAMDEKQLKTNMQQLEEQKKALKQIISTIWEQKRSER